MVTARWLVKGRELWLAAKAEARQNGLLYPRCITDIVLRHAKQSDPNTAYLSTVPPEENPELWWSYLIGMEAYFINVMAALFGSTNSEFFIQLKKDVLLGDVQAFAINIVVRQRILYQEQEQDE